MKTCANQVVSRLAMAAVAVSLVCVPGWAQSCPTDATTLIDNFKTGHLAPVLLKTAGSKVDLHQFATVPGGVRREYFQNVADPFHQVAEYGIVSDPTDSTGKGALVVGNGARGFFLLEVFYGFDANNNFVPLHYFPPTGCDRFRVTFDSSSRVVNFNLEAWTPKKSGSGEDVFLDGINMAENAGPFCVEFPFANFSTNSPGVTEDFVHTGIDVILPILQSGSAMGANDFVVKKIELAQGNGRVNGSACAIANFK